MNDRQPSDPRIDTRRVTFDSEGVRLVGVVHVPITSRPTPGVVVTGSWTTVKEQMAGLYARRLAREGFATLAFDFRGFGESDGDPRAYESPSVKAKDIQNAVTFMESVSDGSRIGALAVCASAGYAALASTEDARIRSLALVAPWLHDAELVRQLYGGEPGVLERMSRGRIARAAFEATGRVETVPAVSATDARAAMFGAFDYYLDPSRGAVPEWGNAFAVMSWPAWLAFDAIQLAPRIRAPTLLVHSEAAAIPDGAKRFFAAVAAAKDARWIAGTQFDFYDREPTVSLAIGAAVEHFRKTLD